MVDFTRQLGNESGIQLNPLQDESEVSSASNEDQVYAVAGRFLRGPIDRPFVVTRSNFERRLGSGEPMRVTDLNETYVQVYESLQKGAMAVIVQRLADATSAKIGWVLASVDGTGITFSETDQVVALAGNSVGLGDETTLVDTSAVSGYLLAIKHLECFNDGIVVSIHADEAEVDGSLVSNDVITLRLKDKSGSTLYEFTGSLNPYSVDDYGNTNYLPDIVSTSTDLVEVMVGVTGAAAVIDTTSDAYGYSDSGTQNWVTSDVLKTFTEGGTTYAADDYQRVASKLEQTNLNYGFLASGGSKNVTLLTALMGVSYQRNVQFRLDVPGSMTPAAAITFLSALNASASATNHLIHAFWCPVKSLDPSGVNPKGYFGTAALNIAMACQRNSVTNAFGISAKNYPVAGSDFPVSRTGMTQTYVPGNKELSQLAKAGINPVVFETYSFGSQCVFLDSLTASPTNSLKKLISVADMSTFIDVQVVRYGKEALQKPMSVAIELMTDFITDLFESVEKSGWLVASEDPEMDGASFQVSVQANANRPYDSMDYSYKVRYDGTNRQAYVTQTLTR
jgi:hypothetical protein